MARPRKNNEEYFSHDANMRDDLKIKAVRRKFSHTGYAVWNYLLETLTDSDFFEIVWDDVIIDLLAADYGVTVELLDEIVNYLVKIGLLCLDGNKLYSPSHRKRLAPLMTERNRRRNTEQDSTGVLPVQNSGNTEDMPEFCQDSTGVLPGFPKVKESKVKESIVEDSKGGYKGDDTSADNSTEGMNAGGSAPAPHKYSESFLKFQKWITNSAPRVAKMKEPMTEEQYQKLKDKYPTEQICEVLQAMHNYEPLIRRNRSAYLTASNWLRRHDQTTPQKQTPHETRKTNFL